MFRLHQKPISFIQVYTHFSECFVVNLLIAPALAADQVVVREFARHFIDLIPANLVGVDQMVLAEQLQRPIHCRPADGRR